LELLSIIVPVYNEDATVRQVIDRRLAIDLPVAREILVVNDGSTDGTRGVRDDMPAVSWLTIVANKTLTAVANLLYGSRITDIETCSKILRAEVARHRFSR
jgi:glycosyltransferase involved in cell wall biosynthesis